MMDFVNNPTVGTIVTFPSGASYRWNGGQWDLLAPVDFAGGALTNVGSINGGPFMDGYRNKIINGDFMLWQRGASLSVSAYGPEDRWISANVGTTKVATQQVFSLGQTAVPGNPLYFGRTVVTSVAGASNYSARIQKIELVQILAGQQATLTFYAKSDAPRNMAVEFEQDFGSGGSPSSPVTGIGLTTIPLTTNWTRYDVLVNIPSIAGKTMGTTTTSSLQLWFWFDAGSSFNARSNSLGQQSGTFDIAHVSLVPGDARKEAEPFQSRSYGQETTLCQRYYQQPEVWWRWDQAGSTGIGMGTTLYFNTTMRGSPSTAMGTDVSSGFTATGIMFARPNCIGIITQMGAAGPVARTLDFIAICDAEL